MTASLVKKSVAAASVRVLVVPAGMQTPAAVAVVETVAAAAVIAAEFYWPGSASAELSDHVAFSTEADTEKCQYGQSDVHCIYSESKLTQYMYFLRLKFFYKPKMLLRTWRESLYMSDSETHKGNATHPKTVIFKEK